MVTPFARGRSRRWAAMFFGVFTLCGFSPDALAGPVKERDPEDILGELVVEASSGDKIQIPKPKIAVEAPTFEGLEGVAGQAVVLRDLELSGEFDIVQDSRFPAGVGLVGDFDASFDRRAWRSVDVDAVVRLRERRLDQDRTELSVRLFLTTAQDKPVFEKAFVAPREQHRAIAHQLADGIIGAMTGTDGSFASDLAFVVTNGSRRRVQVVDADGFGLRTVSGDDELVLSPAFGPEHRIYYAASVRNGRYRLVREGSPEPLPITPNGSIYGVEFSPDRSRIALAIADGETIAIHQGPSELGRLERSSKIEIALHPSLSLGGKLAYEGIHKGKQRIYVDGKVVSPAGLPASSPTFCRHPDGTRLVYAVGVGKRNDLVSTTVRGAEMVRLTRNQGRNSYPACSPDGRLVAFFSTRKTGEGPGLYVMRLTDRRARKISGIVGDSLAWGRRPAIGEEVPVSP